MRRAIIIVALAAVWPVAAAAAPKKDTDDWGAPKTLRDLVKKAAEEDVPVVILYQIKNSDCPKHNAKVELFEKQSSLRSMDRCRYYTGGSMRDIGPLRSAIPHLRYCPYLMYTDGQGHLIGYVPYEGNAADVLTMSRLARDVTRWKKQARATLKDVATQTQEKKFSEALAAVTRLDQEDRELTGRIDWSIRKVCQKTPKPEAPDPTTVPGDETEQEKPQDDGVVRRPEPEPQKTDDESEKLPPRPEPAEVGVLMNKEIVDATRLVRLAIDDHFTRAQVLYAQGETKAAVEALTPLLAIEGDDQLHKKVVELKADLDKAQAESGGATPPAPAPAPPASE